ncbi:hypothetical protein F511_25015 [Dorcoceras hygrometricum]|uniref:Dystroglycan-like n=1 Tax=Dorcoceras hygrometricum TaxID=472368 RepID=A0A2Z7CEG6_9LAMI|nr:hypothetical protein F511_25015 [Dorcoceras hygrometricum]
MDNPGMVSMFEALMASGLSGFLGCPAVLHEDALTEFFLNGSVRDGKVVSTIRGKQVEISEELFASTFELPVDGLTDLSEIPKDIVFDARRIFSFSGEQVSTSGKKREMKFEFRFLSDILAKTITVKAGSFDAVTQERFFMMAAITRGVAINWNRLLFNILKGMVTAGSRQAKGYAIQISLLLENVPNLELGDYSEFPSSRILTKKTVHRYIAINDKVGVEEVADVPRVKRTPVTKVVSRKRTAAVDEPIVKKNRTRVGKYAAVATDSALEEVPVQVVAPISTVPSPAPKRKIQKRKRRLALGSDDEIVGEPTTVAVEVEIENIVEEQRVEMPVDPVIAENSQVETNVGRTNVSGPDVEDRGVKTANETELWFNLSYEEFATREANRPVETGSDTEEEFVTEKVTATDADVQTETGSDVYLVETPFEQTELFQGTETSTSAPIADKNISDDESMTLEAILSTISDDLSLPSTFGEITPILFGKSISIPGVDEGDWYKASLPKINHADKGKAPLQERHPVKGNPVKEQLLLIVADIDLLVQLREQEGQVLSWAETDSTRIALQRKMYILTKYIEFLLRKFLEIRLSNFVPGVATPAVNIKFLDMLSNLHLFVIDELKVLSQAHGLRWEKPCCSIVFEGPNRDRGAVIARSNTNIKSTCWIRSMIRINGTWVIEPCADYWQQIPRVVASSIVVIPSRLSYVDTLPLVSEFFKLLKKRWADVCIEAAQFFVSGKQLPYGSLNFCRTIAVVEPVSVFGSQSPTVTLWGWSQLCTAFVRYSLFSGLRTVDIRNFVSTLTLNRSVLRDVQLVTHSVSVASSVQTYIASVFAPDVQSITYTDSSLHFNANDISTEDDEAFGQSILPSSATDISASLAVLREYFSKLVANQTRDSRKSSDAHSEVLCKIDHVERVFLDSLAAQNEAFRGLFKSIRQEAQNDNNALSLALKAVRAQNAILSTDLAATQKEVKDLKAALSKDFDDKLADIRNDLLQFRVETQEQLASLGARLAELISFITKGSDDKKGEGSSSRPLPPPDDQNRPIGGSGSRADDPIRYGGGTVSREGGNRGGDGRRRGDSSGSSNRTRSDSGGGSGGRINYGPYLPPKRDAEYWISGKIQF